MPQPGNLARIERHRRRRAAITGKYRADTCGKSAVPVKAAFELDQHGDAAVDEIAQLAEGQHALVAAAERHALELGGAQPIEPALTLSEPAEHVVVMDHGLAVGAGLDVDLYAVICGDGRADGAGAVLDQAMSCVMQAAVSDGPRGEPVEPVWHGSRYFKQALDLNRGIGRQRRDADRRARMLAFVAEHRDHEVGGAVHHLWAFGEPGG